MIKTNINAKNSKPKSDYWYHYEITVCPPCGRESITKERQYTEKPKNSQERYELIEHYCGCLER